jgi:hypothetical protein
VEVLPRFKPRDRRFDIPGVVSVMALPPQALSRAPNPRPDRPFIERLHAYLAARSPLATELYVIGCEYVPLGVSVGVTLRDGHARDQVLNEVRQALQRLLAAAARRRRCRGLAARPPRQGARAGGRGLARRRRARSHRARAVCARGAGVRPLATTGPMQPNRSSWRRGSCRVARGRGG